MPNKLKCYAFHVLQASTKEWEGVSKNINVELEMAFIDPFAALNSWYFI